jgi:hypothetical protein
LCIVGIHWQKPQAEPLTGGKVSGELLFLEQALNGFPVLDNSNGPLAIYMLDGNGSRPRRILGVHGCFFDLRATASINERAAASQAVLDGPFADSTTSADFSDMPYFLAKAAVS